METEREEGEMSDNEMDVDDIEEPAVQNMEKHTVLYKKDKNGLVVELLEKVDALKLEERAKRFGFSLTGNRVVTQEQIDDLYNNFDIKEGNERHFRFDTLHLAGIDGLSTKDIFEYLEDYKPVAIEWIDNNSCNIVCHDHIAVALALLLHSQEITDEGLKEMIHEKSSYHWREGLPHPNVDMILMRFATHSDKKMKNIKYESKQISQCMDDGNMVSKNPWGDLCRSWGVYDHQEIFSRKLPQDYDEEDDDEPNETIQIKSKQLAKRLGKRSNKTEDSDEGSSDSEWKKKSKTPRMRMHADDEELKHKKPVVEYYEEENTYAPLSIEVINTKSDYTPRPTLRVSENFRGNAKTDNTLRKKSLQSRLGAKVPARESSDEITSDNSDSHIMSRVQKVNKMPNHQSSSVWSRLELKSNSIEDLDRPKDLRQKLKSRKQKKPDDLRDVLSKTKQSNLIIEVDNRNK